jgi:hypothetical protein
MNFDHLGPARDLFSLTFLLLGGALGSFLMTLRRSCTIHSGSRWIAVLLCFVSVALAALAGAVILSRGLVCTVPVFYLMGLFFLALGTAALRFPRAGGCTMIFAAGLFTVWLCVTYFAYPRFDDLQPLIVRAGGDGELIIRRGAAVRNRTGGSPAGEAEIWNVSGGGIIRFEAASINAHPAYPLIGGSGRGLITRVSRDREELFTLTNRLYRLVFSGGLGFSVETRTLEFSAGALPAGVSLTVLFDGTQLSVDPPIQL